MRTPDRKLVAQLVLPTADETAWQWAGRCVDFKRAPNYDTGFKEPFDPELMPFWKEPTEMLFAPSVREVVVDKCSRAGGTEHLFLNPVRYKVAVLPETCLYVTDQVENAETFMKDRIIRGFRTAPACYRAYLDARKGSTEHKLRFPGMDLAIGWSRSKSTYKQDGWPFIFCDELSMWPSFGVDQIRKRADMYAFHHIAFISSPDPTRKGNPDNDPILVLYRDTDQRRWIMPDPGKAGKWFTFQFGEDEGKYGVKWPADAKVGEEWDLDRVRKETTYLTEHGTVITNDQREDLMRAGKWQATAESKRDDVVGYKVVAPMIPTHAGDFGELAARFLAAKQHLDPTATRQERVRNSIRVYFAEYWAEAHREQEIRVHDNRLQDRRADYERKSAYVSSGFTHGVYVTCDMQKYHQWWVARVWSVNEKTGEVETALLDWGNVAIMADFDAKAGEFDPGLVGIDIGYELRASEVGDYCAQYTEQHDPSGARVMALRGSDTLQKSITDVQIRDSFEGRKRHGQALFMEITWSTDVFRSWLVEMMEGDKVPWWIPDRENGRNLGESVEGSMISGAEYLRQVTSTRKVDGVWVPPTHGQDHMFDCECMQLVLARYDQLIR